MTREGLLALVLGDVSGYPAFLDARELDHSRKVLAELLGLVAARTENALGPANVGGSTLLWGDRDVRPDLVAHLTDALVAFHRRGLIR